jgi:rhamnose transport system permease protein
MRIGLMSVPRIRREAPVAVAYVALLIVLAALAPSFFGPANLRDLLLNNVSLLIVGIGMTLVILIGEIDISVASQVAVCSVIAGVLAKAGVPLVLLPIAATVVGAGMGAINGVLVGVLAMPSIIVTLAMLVVWRDGLRWVTDGAWVQNLPASFQWFGLAPYVAHWLIVIIAAVLVGGFAWTLRNLTIGRALYAVGSDAEAARLAGIEPRSVTVLVFVLMGALVGLASFLNAIRFNSIPSNAGVGLELKAVAAVVVGGAAITGGRASLLGTVIGVALLGTIGPALAFLGINPFWEKAIQGMIIVGALASDTALNRLVKRAHVRVIARSTAVVR